MAATFHQTTRPASCLCQYGRTRSAHDLQSVYNIQYPDAIVYRRLTVCQYGDENVYRILSRNAVVMSTQDLRFIFQY